MYQDDASIKREEEKKESLKISTERTPKKGNYKTIPCWKDTVRYSANDNIQTAHGGVYCHALYIVDGW